ncbi:2-phospho-L-lactate guanylyltransferase [Saccharomonospora sp. CUA-673]|uniref:2-phospho-L-lactate guanylyltransferase n=1 Tax=Saccharomonospora sp. CUA-673 TaxID=1904969 RepID=UPI000961538E|nr:2-phospho-L-lactate guanylyltransferase [Saccharomonospora sp. CUA-673]OLT46267.1 2-phospho-L-lactate guanylyltransferase [Saccharomonospora sp. CUA-673]
MAVTLLVPLKPPGAGKSRLRGAFGAAPHASVVLALAADTVAAAVTTPGVDRVVVVTSDVEAVTTLRELGADVVDDGGAADLNAALRAAELRLSEPAHGATGHGTNGHGPRVVGALQADLPALRSADLAAALAEAEGRRAFVADHLGTGTTLLLAAPGRPLAPRFGAGSAAAHTASGARPLTAPGDSLRSDVDTADDLARARTVGVGRHTSGLLAHACPVP